MTSDGWTRDSLIEFASGKRLFMRSAEAQHLPTPKWLGEVADEVSELDSAQSVDATHPEDRALLIESFIESIERPGEVVSRQIRFDRDGLWHHSVISWLNLLDHPEVNAILGAGYDVDGPEIEAPTKTVEGTMSATNWMIVTLDDHGRVTGARGRLEEILGFTEEEVCDHLLTDFIHADCVPDAIENWIHLISQPGQTRTSRWVWKAKDGAEPWLESSYLVHDHGLVEVVIVDVNEQVINEAKLAESQAEVATLAEDFRLLADEVPTAVFRCDASGRVQFRNTQWSEMFDLDGEVDDVRDLIDPTQRHQFDDLLTELAGDHSTTSRSIEVPGSCGVRVLEIRCRAVGGVSERFVGSIADVTAAAHFRHQALHDPLTGLANRAMIESLLAEALKEDPEGTLVVFIDLDGFKVVNDDHGHEAGDTVLSEVGRRLSSAVRPGDSVARYGGDEFVVVCRRVTDDGVDQITERLGQVFAATIEFGGGSWAPRASLGVARAESDADAATVLRRADHAMFEAKRSRQADSGS